MKKLLFLLLISPIITFAQLKNGRYFIKLIANGKAIQYNPTYKLMLANSCADFNCPNQFFDFTAVPGLAGIYTIKNVQTGKYLTFSDLDDYETTSPAIKLEPLISGVNKRFQQFLIESDKDGIYAVHPRKTTGTQEVFLATQFNAVSTGGTQVHLEYKTRERNPVEYQDLKNVLWNLIPLPGLTITRTPTSAPGVVDRTIRSSPVVVAPPSDNKIDIDITTGSDNLEMKPYQDNVEIRVILQNRADAVLLNANNGQNWPNNSLRRVSVPLPANITVDEIKELHIYRKQKTDGTPIATIFNLAEKDNWNLFKISATAKIKESGVLKTYRFDDLVTPSGMRRPLFRFVYEGGDGKTEGKVFKGVLSRESTNNTNIPTPRTAVANPILIIETLTGGDDLRGGNDNLNVLLKLKIRPVRNITFNNINASRNWRNFSTHKITLIISAPPFSFDDIEDFTLKHTGSTFGIGIDNWYLDKLKITLTIGGETRILVDQVAEPIHYFKGDSRSKIFPINP